MWPAATITLLGALLAAGCDRAADAMVDDAWLRAAPPGATAQAGYLTLRNPSRQPTTVVGVRSEAFGRIEIHATVDRDGLSTMRRIRRLQIPAGGEVRLEPGGRHLMLMDPLRSIRAGDRVGFVLDLADGSECAFTAVVRDHAP